MGYSPWGHKESDETVQLTHTHRYTHKTLVTLNYVVDNKNVKKLSPLSRSLVVVQDSMLLSL